MRIIGHRGAPALAPENTLASFAAAVNAGCDLIELDVQQVEGRLLVFHDDTLERTTDGRGRLSAHSVAHLRQLDAGQGQRIPFLEEVIEQTPEAVTVQVELKGANTAAAVAEVLGRYPRHRFLLSSFRLDELRALRPLTAHPFALLFKRAPATWPRWVERLAPVAALHVRWNTVTPDLVRQAHQLGLSINVWTVDDAAIMARMGDLGVDGVFSNCPQRWLGLSGSK